jgi:hypothetical protein
VHLSCREQFLEFPEIIGPGTENRSARRPEPTSVNGFKAWCLAARRWETALVVGCPSQAHERAPATVGRSPQSRRSPSPTIVLHFFL